MKQSESSFRASLKVGEEFEVNVAQKLLHQLFEDYCIVPTHNFQIRNQVAGGPRIHLTDTESIILPDFLLVSKLDPNNKLLVEAKWKKNGFFLPDRRMAFAIEDYKCLEYEAAADIMGAKLLYLIGNEQTRDVYLYSDDQYKHHSFCNSFTNNRSVLNRAFLQTQKHVVGEW